MMGAPKFVPLCDVAEVRGGGKLKLSGKDFVATGFPAFGAGGLNGYLPVREFDRQGVVLASTGTCGRCYLSPADWTSLANTQVILPRPEVADARFLWYQLNDPSRWPISGTAQPFIKPSDVKAHLVYLPTLEEQQRIASILDTANALREKCNQALDILDTLIESIFHDMFGELAGNPARCTPLAKLIRENDRINYGVVQPGDETSNGVPMIRVGDLVNGRVEHGAIKRIAREIDARYDRSRLVGDEILLSCVGSAGVVALATQKEAGWNIARAVARIPLAETVEREFVAAFLSSEIAQRYFENELRTVSQPTLNIKQIKETPIPIAGMAEQAEFGRRAKEIRRLRDHHLVHQEQMNALFASLQHRAFRGEL